MKGHNISCFNIATASKSVSWPSLPLTHSHQFTSWPWHCLAKASSEVPHCTGRDKVWPAVTHDLSLPLQTQGLQPHSYPTRKLYSETLILVQALFGDPKTYFSPSTQVQHQAPMPPHNVKGKSLNVRTREDDEKQWVNGHRHHWCAPTMCKVLYIHFCIESFNNPERSF